MSEDSFYAYLKQGGRSDAAAARCQILVDEFAHWLGHDPLSAEAADIDAYIVHRGREAKGSLWALRYFFDYCNRSDLARLTGERRQELIEPATHSLASLEGVPSDLVARLTADGIRSIEDLRRAAADRDERRRLAERTGPGFADLYELARFMEIRGVKNVRGRLYRGCAGTLEYRHSTCA